MQKIFQVVTTRILYLGLSLPDNIQCHWNIPPLVHMPHPNLIIERCNGWRLSIVQTNQVLVGILWRDIHQPKHAQIAQVINFYEGVFQLLHLLPHTEHSITIEAVISLQHLLLDPSKSDWRERFQVRRLHAVIKSFQQVQFSLIHPKTLRFSNFISRNVGTIPINFCNLENLYNSLRD